MAARVLWLTKGLGLGGAERLLSLVAPQVDQSRFDVEVAYLLPWKDALVGDLERHGVRAFCLRAGHPLNPSWVGRLRSLLQRRSYDLVHTHSPLPAAAARLLASDDTALVHTEHNVWARYRAATRLVNAATYRRNDAVIAVSDGVAASIAPPRWAGRGAGPRVETLHHGVDLDQVQRGAVARQHARALLDLPPDVRVLGTVANFTPKKDHLGVLAALDSLRRDVEDVTLLLIGTGPLEASLRAEVRRRGLDRHVRFLGMRDDVLELLPALDLFVLGSRFEGLPIALLEAMAAGVPCVATRVGGVHEAVQDGQQGVLVPPGDPAALAAAALGLVLDPDRRERMGASGVERVREHFSIDRAARRIEAIYEEVLRSRRASATASRLG
jgi:glycosyltransferase involved in cell wall biosynthesis